MKRNLHSKSKSERKETKQNLRKIAELLAMHHNIPLSKAQKYLNFTFDFIGHALEGAHDVQIYRFGKFSTVVRKPREGRNPKTGERISIPERSVVTFKPAAKLKRRLKVDTL